MSTPTYSKYTSPFDAIAKIEHEALAQGLSNKVYQDEIRPILDSMLKIKTSNTGVAIKIEYVIDWTAFNKVVDAHRPLDVRTLKYICENIKETRIKWQHREEDDGPHSRGVSHIYVALEAYIEGLIQEAEKR